MIRVGTNVDPTALRRTFGCFPSGVTAVCGSVDDRPIGMTVSAFTSVSLDPPLVSVCVANASKTWPALRSANLIGVSVLNETQGAICRQLSRGGDRFAGVPWDISVAGAVLIEGAAAWLECEVSDEVPAGDHRIVLLRIRGTRANTEIAPLVHHGSRLRGLGADRPAADPPRPVHHDLVLIGESTQGSRLLDRIAQIIAASSS